MTHNEVVQASAQGSTVSPESNVVLFPNVESQTRGAGEAALEESEAEHSAEQREGPVKRQRVRVDRDTEVEV